MEYRKLHSWTRKSTGTQILIGLEAICCNFHSKTLLSFLRCLLSSQEIMQICRSKSQKLLSRALQNIESPFKITLEAKNDHFTKQKLFSMRKLYLCVKKAYQVYRSCNTKIIIDDTPWVLHFRVFGRFGVLCASIFIFDSTHLHRTETQRILPRVATQNLRNFEKISSRRCERQCDTNSI